MQYAAGNMSATMCNGFEVAFCRACKPCPVPYNNSFRPGQGCPNCTQPPTPPPPPLPPSPPPPPVPPGGQPCLRFGNAIASPHSVDAEIVQGTTTFSWSNYRFGSFSDWVLKFQAGAGTINVYENAGGVRGGLLLSTKIPLTPGPLVVVVKDTWPPNKPTNVETIAASFVPCVCTTACALHVCVCSASHDWCAVARPCACAVFPEPMPHAPCRPTNGSAVRLFNLAVDVKAAGLKDAGGTVLADGIRYSLGSKWEPVPALSQSYSTFSDSGASSTALASASFTAPAAPMVFTTFLMGSIEFGYTLVPQLDAPEFGPCRPQRGGRDAG